MSKKLEEVFTLDYLSFTCGHEGRFDGRRRPAWVGSLNISCSSTSMWARHGSARDYVVVGAPGIVLVN